MTDVEKRRKFIINTLYYIIVAIITITVYKYAMGVAFPLTLAFCVSLLLQKPRNFIIKHSFIKKGLASAICVFLFYGVFAAIFILVGIKIFQEVKDFVFYIIDLFQNVNELVDIVENFLVSFANRLPDFLSKPALEGIDGLFVQIREAIAGTSSELTDNIADGLGENFEMTWVTAPLSGVISTVSMIPSFIISVVISIVATCFMTSEYDYIVNFIKLQFPEEKRKDLSRAKKVVGTSLAKMGKAYLLIMFITFIEVYSGLTILKLIGLFNNNYIIIFSIIIAIVDIAPMLGTGTILLPWTVFEFISGNYAMAIGLFILYAVITVIRQIIEPKLVAGQLGLSPVITISALYLGLKLIGFWGIFIAPLTVIILKILTDEGILHFWRSPVRVAAEKEAAEKQAAEKAKAKKESEKKSEEKTL